MTGGKDELDKIVLSVVGGALAIIIGVCGVAYGQMYSRISVQESLSLSRGIKLQELETNYNNISSRLLRMENKLDVLIEQVMYYKSGNKGIDVTQ